MLILFVMFMLKAIAWMFPSCTLLFTGCYELDRDDPKNFHDVPITDLGESPFPVEEQDQELNGRHVSIQENNIEPVGRRW